MAEGYLAPNVSKNTQIPHGVNLLFKRTGETSYIDLGDISDLSINPAVEFLEYFSSHDAKQALAKRISQQKTLTIEATVNEVAPETLRLAFYGGAESAAAAALTATSIEKFTVTGFGAGGSVANVLTVAGDFHNTIAGVTSIKTADGTAVDLTDDYTFTGGIITFVAAGIVTIETDVDVIVEYTYSTTVKSFELMGTDLQEGIVEFHVRNMDGGLEQIFILDNAQIAPNGAVSLAGDAVQSFPLTITAQLKNGVFGNMYYKSV